MDWEELLKWIDGFMKDSFIMDWNMASGGIFGMLGIIILDNLKMVLYMELDWEKIIWGIMMKEFLKKDFIN